MGNLFVVVLFSFIQAQAWAGTEASVGMLDSLSGDERQATYDLQEAFVEFKERLKEDKSYRKLFKRGARSEDDKVKALSEFQDFFEERNVKFGYLKTDQFSAFNLLILGFTLRGNDVNYGNAQLELGPGLGFMKGYDIVACLLHGKGINGGVAARVVAGAGISAGLFFGQNGACINLGVGLGLNLSGGLGALFVDEQYLTLEI